MNRTHPIARMAVAALLALLAAPLAFGVGTGGTGLRVYAHGALTTYGGVVVNGITFDPSQAGITINGRSGRNVNELKPGMVAGVDGDVVPGQSSGVAYSIQVTRVVLGAVTEVTPGAVMQVGTGGTGLRLRVSGIYVYVRPDTVVDGCGSLADIPVGTIVDVYGYSDGTTGMVDATRIECVGPSGEVELHGVASAITATSMVVQGVTVDITNAQFVGFSGPIAAGDRVEVDGTSTASGVVADTVTFDPEDGDSPNGQEVEVEDAISGVMSPSVFVVDKFEVDATNAKFSGGTAANIAVGRVVHVEGNMVNGIVNAKSVAFDDGESNGGDGTEHPAGAEMADVDGTISAFASAASFVVDGITIDASAATFSNGAAADLANGKFVKVTGTRTGTTMKAATVRFSTGGSSGDGDGDEGGGTPDGDADEGDANTHSGDSGKSGGHNPDPGEGEGENHNSGGSTSSSGNGSGGSGGSTGKSGDVEGKVGSVSSGVFTVGSRKIDARNAKITGGTLSDIRVGKQVHAYGKYQSSLLVATRVSIEH